MAYEVREILSEVGVGEAEEVPLASPPGPLCEHGEGKDLARRQQGRATGLPWRGRVGHFPPVVHQHVHRNEQGFEIHVTPPSLSGNCRGGGPRMGHPAASRLLRETKVPDFPDHSATVAGWKSLRRSSVLSCGWSGVLGRRAVLGQLPLAPPRPAPRLVDRE